MDKRTPISDLSNACKDLFSTIIEDPKGASALVVEVIYQRFTQWVSYLGVFAMAKVSLDARLKYSESISQLVLQFLQILFRNLVRINELDSNLAAKLENPQHTQQNVVDEFNRAPPLGTASPLVESLRALNTALDGLYRLGAAIRQSASPTLNQRISQFAQSNEDVAIENIVFLRLKNRFFDNSPKESNNKSPLSLYRQLAVSISFRHFGLLYRHSRQEELGRNKDIEDIRPPPGERAVVPDTELKTPVQTPTRRRNEGSVDEMRQLALRNIRVRQRLGESVGTPTTINTKQFYERYNAMNKSFAAPRSTVSAHIKDIDYPNPPSTNSLVREATCPYCKRPISETDLKRRNWWHNHLDEDLKLYTCLAEACAEPPQLFTHLQDWSQHMDDHHSEDWIRTIHKPLGWCCDLGDHDLPFEDEDEYDRHVQEYHPEYDNDRIELKQWSELQRERPAYTCPICNCIPEELAAIIPKLDAAALTHATRADSIDRAEHSDPSEKTARERLIFHIGTHLKQLGLMSATYFIDGLDYNSIGGRRDSISVDKDGNIVLTEDPPEYLDPQFKNYKSPTELVLLEQDIDWSDVPRSGTLEGPFLVPYSRNNSYVGNGPILALLEQSLLTEEDTRIITVTGLSGIGKTQFVIELLYRIKTTHQQVLVIWMPASNLQKLIEAYNDVAQRLGLFESGHGERDAKILVREFLSRNNSGPWLLIFDGANDLDMWMPESGPSPSNKYEPQRLSQYLPESKNGTIVFTTRNKRMTGLVGASKSIEIAPMSEAEAIELLEQHLEDKLLVDSRLDADIVVSRLAYFPLAITRAAEFINTRRFTLKELRDALTKEKLSIAEFLIPDRNVQNPRPPPCGIEFERLEQRNKDAFECLAFVACIDHKNIPVSLLPSRLSSFDRAYGIETLNTLFLVTKRPTESWLDVHPLVHLAARQWFQGRKELVSYRQRVISQMIETLPSDESHDRDWWTTNLPHAVYLLTHDVTGQGKLDDDIQNDDDNLILMQKFGQFCLTDRSLATAEILLKRLVAAQRRLYGPSDLRTSRGQAMLALTYHNQERFEEAVKLQNEVFQTRTSLLGVSHIDTLSCQADLALILHNQGHQLAAEEMQKEVMGTIRGMSEGFVITGSFVRGLGTAALAGLYEKNKAKREAQLSPEKAVKDAMRKSVEDSKEAVVRAPPRRAKEENLQVIPSMVGLALMYYNQGRWQEAEELELEVLKIRKRVLGNEHPDTLASMADLALTYYNQSRWREGEELQVEVVRISTSVLGREDPETLTSMTDLALTYLYQKRLAEAAKILEQVVAARNRVLGSDHLDTLSCTTNLALTYWAQERLEEAERLEQEIIQTQKRVLGEDHADTLNSMARLASTYLDQDRATAARRLQREVLDTMMRVLGIEHPNTLTVMEDLASTYYKQGFVANAEQLQTQVVKTRTRILGLSHPDTESSLDFLIAIRHA